MTSPSIRSRRTASAGRRSRPPSSRRSWSNGQGPLPPRARSRAPLSWRVMEYRDYYDTLGLKRDATQAEIRKAFRRLAREHHPDVNTGDSAAERRFKEVSEANEVLSDPEKRASTTSSAPTGRRTAMPVPERAVAGHSPAGTRSQDSGAPRADSPATSATNSARAVPAAASSPTSSGRSLPRTTSRAPALAGRPAVGPPGPGRRSRRSSPR